MDLKLNEKVVVVTGGSQGIGKAITWAFAKEGCKVATCSRSQAKLDELAEEFKAAGHDLFVKSVDVSQTQDLIDFGEDVYKHFGRIDVWVNNVGQFKSKSILEQSIEDWNEIMHVNLDSYFTGTQIAAGKMKQTGGGVIVNVSSFGGVFPAVYRSSYNTSKYAINWFTRCSASELGPFGIRVNAVAPGTINTEMQKASGRTLADIEALSKNFALHRMGEPEEVASVVLFLASDMSSYVDGIVIECSGGKFLAQNCDTAWVEKR
ncbi:MAG: SDR family oxidoreductase [Clostridium sp.]|nr:SDR family oxidoreductase [Clostridium sp.]